MKKLFLITILLPLLSFGQDSISINQVNARFNIRGPLFYKSPGSPAYEVPKGSGKHSMFSSGLWMSGKDENETSHISVSQFNVSG